MYITKQFIIVGLLLITHSHICSPLSDRFNSFDIVCPSDKSLVINPLQS